MQIHMIGICGTGMGSLAGLLSEAGHQVRGSDENVYPPISTMLRGMGISILEGYRPSNLEPAPDLVIVGNVVNKDNPEVRALVASGLEYLSMPQALGRFFLSSRHSIVVGGTHGKTTTTAMIARMFMEAGRDPSFLVGGVLKDLDRSYRLGRDGADALFVIEGDEYETSFFDKGPKLLHYMPRTAVLTSVEYDHAEMYPTLDAVKEAFARFVALVPPAADGGRLVVCADDPIAMELAASCKGEVVPYGLGPAARLAGREVESGPGGLTFEARLDDVDLGLFHIQLTGRHNLRNALSAVAVGRGLGLSTKQIAEGLAVFSGVRRRQEIRGIAGGVTVVDDFAHHPTAVRETIAAIKARFPGQRVWAIFEPRTNTTRRDVFQEEYARSFDGADEVLLAPVDHPERAPEGRRFSIERLADDLNARGISARYMPGGVTEIVSHLAERARRGDAVLVMSNGGFGGIHDRLLAALSSRCQPGQRPA
ncbi:MAG TPA: Mur ligase family protein [Candidatus Polarisedimenticolia bacterium]|nr:Mur ligase family protein [Candidatus Polarisedimenticolia bacterium]